MSLLNPPFDPVREAALVAGAGNGIGRAIAQFLVGERVGTILPMEIGLVRDANRGQQDLGRGNHQVGAMMFSDADEIDPEAVGENRFFDHAVEHLRLRRRNSVRSDGRLKIQ